MTIPGRGPLTSAAIEHLEALRIGALLAADGDALAALQYDDGVVVHSSGFVDAMGSYAVNLSAGTFAYDSLEVNDRRIEIIGDLAVVVYRQDANMLVRGERLMASVRCCAVWSKQAGRIGLALVQSTRLSG